MFWPLFYFTSCFQNKNQIFQIYISFILNYSINNNMVEELNCSNFTIFLNKSNFYFSMFHTDATSSDIVQQAILGPVLPWGGE